ncbi:MAG: histidine phosphatase family protein [Alphaproteobacteria bacterium]|nr:histidine phosphatase family protein [Alphaproteobacteria bacterium]
MKLALLRHGPTEWNVLGRIQGHTDIPLSDAGRAKMAALRLPDALAPARIFSSPMLRARQTAEALGFSNPVLDARLMEQNWGQWEGLTRAQILERHGANAFEKAGAARREEFRPLGGESTGELHARVANFLQDVSRGEADAVAVAHLGVLARGLYPGQRLGDGCAHAGATGCVAHPASVAGAGRGARHCRTQSGIHASLAPHQPHVQKGVKPRNVL